MRVSPNDISILEQSTGFRYNARVGLHDSPSTSDRYAQRFSVSYVTGSHAFKVGIQIEQGVNNRGHDVHGDVNYTFLNGVPNRVTQCTTPYLTKDRVLKADLGIYAQDQWTIKRLTLNWVCGSITSTATCPPSMPAATVRACRA